jgi:TPP-dependent pyruvate/acetoin dehydrogenase alpha subunit
LTRRKDYVERYGSALIESKAYHSADDELRAKVLKRFAERTNELANERDPDPGKLDHDVIARGIRKSENTTEKKRERSRERLFYAPAQ